MKNIGYIFKKSYLKNNLEYFDTLELILIYTIKNIYNGQSEPSYMNSALKMYTSAHDS